MKLEDLIKGYPNRTIDRTIEVYCDKEGTHIVSMLEEYLEDKNGAVSKKVFKMSIARSLETSLANLATESKSPLISDGSIEGNEFKDVFGVDKCDLDYCDMFLKSNRGRVLISDNATHLCGQPSNPDGKENYEAFSMIDGNTYSSGKGENIFEAMCNSIDRVLEKNANNDLLKND